MEHGESELTPTTMNVGQCELDMEIVQQMRTALMILTSFVANEIVANSRRTREGRR